VQGALSHVVWIWLAGLVAIFGIMNPFFFSTSNLQNVLVQATVLGLLGLAQSLVLLVGEIDPSIAAMTGISSALGALSIQRLGLPVGMGIILGVAIATLIGFINGVCVTRLKMVSLIESLGMMIMLQGGLLAISQGNTITDMPDSYNWIGQATVGGWPIMPLVLLLGFVAMGFTLRRTILGCSLYATGGNAAAALVAGIRVQRIKIMAFTLSGLHLRRCRVAAGGLADGDHL
jgi:simple sugar transport system permease protein/ribose transport system permease protein